MWLFLVRHASSKNARNQWQAPDSPLGKKGERQAQILAGRSRFARVDKVFTSEWERCGKTAQIIAEKLEIDMEVVDYIHEREQSPEIYGSRRDSKISKQYAKEYARNDRDLDWKFTQEEESIREVLQRAARLERFLVRDCQDKQVLVVSHDLFIRCFISQVLLGGDYVDETMAKIINSITIKPTGISLLRYNYQGKCWRAYYINDFSHLKQMKEG